MRKKIMCLISKRKSPHSLKRDMRCWKVVYKFIKNDRLKPIYYDQNTEYRLNSTHVERRRPDVKPSSSKTGTYVVGAGFVYAFTSLDEAMILRYQFKDVFYPDGRVAVICECTIPAGTEIYSNRIGREVCARKLRFNKILEL